MKTLKNTPMGILKLILLNSFPLELLRSTFRIGKRSFYS
jgi:hypothetical protein